MTRTGRRPGTPRTRHSIVVVARREFAAKGYDATSLRNIASKTAIDPALIVHYFGSKERLFVEAMQLPQDLPEIFEHLPNNSLRQTVEALLSGYLELIDSDKSRNAMLALVRSAVSNEKAAAMLREFFSAELLPNIRRLTSHRDSVLRASLVASQLIGLAAARHVIRLKPLADAKANDVVRLVGPAIEQYLL